MNNTTTSEVFACYIDRWNFDSGSFLVCFYLLYHYMFLWFFSLMSILYLFFTACLILANGCDLEQLTPGLLQKKLKYLTLWISLILGLEGLAVLLIARAMITLVRKCCFEKRNSVRSDFQAGNLEEQTVTGISNDDIVLNIETDDAKPTEAEDDNTCPICMEPNANHFTVCAHKFHEQCIANWLKIKPTCPMCKTNITNANQANEN